MTLLNFSATSAVDPLTIGIVAAGLFVFGLAFDRLYAWADARGDTEGYVWVFVAGGVFVTLVGLGIVFGEWVAIVALALFAASGTPMAIGEMWRFNARRQAGREAARREADGE